MFDYSRIVSIFALHPVARGSAPGMIVGDPSEWHRPIARSDDAEPAGPTVDRTDLDADILCW